MNFDSRCCLLAVLFSSLFCSQALAQSIPPLRLERVDQARDASRNPIQVKTKFDRESRRYGMGEVEFRATPLRFEEGRRPVQPVVMTWSFVEDAAPIRGIQDEGEGKTLRIRNRFDEDVVLILGPAIYVAEMTRQRPGGREVNRVYKCYEVETVVSDKRDSHGDSAGEFRPAFTVGTASGTDTLDVGTPAWVCVSTEKDPEPGQEVEQANKYLVFYPYRPRGGASLAASPEQSRVDPPWIGVESRDWGVVEKVLQTASKKFVPTIPKTQHGFVYRPFAAEPRAAQNRATFGSYANYPYAAKSGDVVGMDLSLGFEFKVGQDEPDPSDRFGWGFFPDISFHMLWDLGGSHSSPIVNTDYRFSVHTRARYRIFSEVDSWHWLAARITLGHESSHLGDELTIEAQRTAFPAPFLRVNVSKNMLTLAGAYEYFDPDEESSSYIRAQLGVDLVDKTWAETGNLSEANPKHTVTQTRDFEIAKAENRHTLFAGVESVFGRPFDGWNFIASLDARLHPVYDFVPARMQASVEMEHQDSYNLILGVRESDLGTYGSLFFYLRGYRGVNPHGQLRVQDDFWLFGFGLGTVI